VPKDVTEESWKKMLTTETYFRKPVVAPVEGSYYAGMVL
jgi:hypothetical protein